MFYNKLLSSRAKMFGVNEATIETIAKRLKGYYQAEIKKTNRQDIDKLLAIKSLFIIHEEIENYGEDKILKSKALSQIKNLTIKKYAPKIIELRKNGLGSQRILNYLKAEHKNIKLSRPTLEKYFKVLGI
jgi:uncharacterized membrane protein